MYLLILLMPLLGFIYAGLFGRFFGRFLSSVFSTTTVFISFFLSLFAFYEVVLCNGGPVTLSLFNWLYIGDVTVYFGLLFDNLTCVMLLIVTGISSLVHLYSIGYMSHDPHISRFMSYLSLFTFFMLILVTADNFVQMFIGWECVGLCSYLLINFWFTRVLANKAALKAMIMNRIADVFFIFGIIILLFTFKTTNYVNVFFLSDFIYNGPSYALLQDPDISKSWYPLNFSDNVPLLDLQNINSFLTIYPEYFNYAAIAYPVKFDYSLQMLHSPVTIIKSEIISPRPNLVNYGAYDYDVCMTTFDVSLHPVYDRRLYFQSSLLRFFSLCKWHPRLESIHAPWLYLYDVSVTVPFEHYTFIETPLEYNYILVEDKDVFSIYGPGYIDKLYYFSKRSSVSNFVYILEYINEFSSNLPYYFDYGSYTTSFGLDVENALYELIDTNNLYTVFHSNWIRPANVGGFYYFNDSDNVGYLKLHDNLDSILSIDYSNTINLYRFNIGFRPLVYTDDAYNLSDRTLAFTSTYTYQYLHVFYTEYFHLLNKFDTSAHNFGEDLDLYNSAVVNAFVNTDTLDFITFHLSLLRQRLLYAMIYDYVKDYLTYCEFSLQYYYYPDLFAEIFHMDPVYVPVNKTFAMGMWYNPYWVFSHYYPDLSIENLDSKISYTYTLKDIHYFAKNRLSRYIDFAPLSFYKNYVFFGFQIDRITLVCFFLFIGSIGKSAQLGLHTWLPDAMEGPTPVSSLLHAATMVTAGVFLLIRSAPLFELSNGVLVFVAIIGGLTAFFSAIVGVFQYDVKKIIAYSTCSQLGYMFFSCGLSNYQIALFHLFNHAFFKALLFLSAGSIIHALCDEQDMRRMGGLLNFLPFTYLCFLVGSLAIMGFPFLTGFYSKDLVLEFTFSRYVVDATFIYFLGTCAAFFTAVYSIRLLLFVFFYNSNSFRAFFSSHESERYMLTSMFLLTIASIFIGFIFSDIMSGPDHIVWLNSAWYDSSRQLDNEFLHPIIKNLPTILSLFGLFLGCLLVEIFNRRSQYVSSIGYLGYFTSFYNKIASFFFNAGFFNHVYNKLFLEFFEFSYDSTNKHLDKGFIEFFGPFGLYKSFKSINSYFRETSPAVIFFDIGYMFFFVVMFFIFVVLHSKIFVFLLMNPGLIPISAVIVFVGKKF